MTTSSNPHQDPPVCPGESRRPGVGDHRFATTAPQHDIRDAFFAFAGSMVENRRDRAVFDRWGVRARTALRSPDDEDLADAARSLLQALRGALGRASLPFDPDRLDARDPALVAGVLPFVRAANHRYLRLRAEGFERLGRAPVLYVGNHNGGIAGPDLCCTLGSLWDALGPEAPLYALAHDFPMRQLQPFGAVLQPLGGIRAAPDNALRALRCGAQVLAYPGGDLDAYRHTSRRDEVVLGQRMGFVRVAQTAGVPIVPIVAHGAHRSAYIFSEGEALARVLRLKRWARLERFPLALALPWGLALGPWLPYLPLPFPIQLRALPPIPAPDGAPPESIRERVRAAMQEALDDLARRAREAS
jgi:1-acyl-sn-glycerol-3-phosphate acyltransferase